AVELVGRADVGVAGVGAEDPRLVARRRAVGGVGVAGHGVGECTPWTAPLASPEPGITHARGAPLAPAPRARAAGRSGRSRSGASAWSSLIAAGSMDTSQRLADPHVD